MAKSATGTPEPGWYLDPSQNGQQRFFDGGKWLDHLVRPMPVPAAPEYIPVEFDVEGRTYQVMMQRTLAAVPGFATYWPSVVTEETDLISGDQVIIKWAGVTAVRLPGQPPAQQRLGNDPHQYP